MTNDYKLESVSGVHLIGRIGSFRHIVFKVRVPGTDLEYNYTASLKKDQLSLNDRAGIAILSSTTLDQLEREAAHKFDVDFCKIVGRE